MKNLVAGRIVVRRDLLRTHSWNWGSRQIHKDAAFSWKKVKVMCDVMGEPRFKLMVYV